MSMSLVQVGGGTAVGAVTGGGLSLVNGYNPRVMAANAIVGGASSLVMFTVKETTGNGLAAFIAGAGTGAALGAALMSVHAGRIGIAPAGAGAMLGAVIGAVSMLASAGVMGRINEG